jgi:prophage regulatory protein
MMTAHAIASENTSLSDRILRPRDLSARIGLSLSTLWRLRRRGDLPEPIRLSPGCVGWRASDIDAWLAARPERRQ